MEQEKSGTPSKNEAREHYSLQATKKAQAYVERLFPVACNLLASAIQGTGKIPEPEDPLILRSLAVAERMMDATGEFRTLLLNKFQSELEGEVDNLAPTLREKGFEIPDLNSFRDKLPSVPGGMDAL